MNWALQKAYTVGECCRKPVWPNISKISPTYPWKVPRMFHQHFMTFDGILSFGVFGEVWRIFPGYMGKIIEHLDKTVYCIYLSGGCIGDCFLDITKPGAPNTSASLWPISRPKQTPSWGYWVITCLKYQNEWTWTFPLFLHLLPYQRNLKIIPQDPASLSQQASQNFGYTCWSHNCGTCMTCFFLGFHPSIIVFFRGYTSQENLHDNGKNNHMKMYLLLYKTWWFLSHCQVSLLGGKLSSFCCQSFSFKSLTALMILILFNSCIHFKSGQVRCLNILLAGGGLAIFLFLKRAGKPPKKWCKNDDKPWEISEECVKISLSLSLSLQRPQSMSLCEDMII